MSLKHCNAAINKINYVWLRSIEYEMQKYALFHSMQIIPPLVSISYTLNDMSTIRKNSDGERLRIQFMISL